jgi:hypothetical protein
MATRKFPFSSDPFFVNLRLIAEEVKTEPGYRIFVDRVRRYGDSMSVLGDLAQARALLEASRREAMSNADGDEGEQLKAGALLSQAIIIYSRATKSRSRHRSFVPVQKGMPGNLRAIHDRVVRLRDDAIAHYGPGPGPGGRHWSKETVVLRIDGSTASLVLPYSHSTYQEDLSAEIGRLVEFCIQNAWEICSERADLLLEECTRLLHSEDSFAGRLQKAEFDVAGFFHDDEASIQSFINSRSTAGTIPPTRYARVRHPTS